MRMQPSWMVVALLVSLPGWAAGGRPQVQAYFQSTLKSASYQQKVFSRVSGVWKQPPRRKAPALGKKAVVQAVISREGKLTSAVVSMESGSKAWDEAARLALEKAAPFPALPPEHPTPSVEVHFHFSWEPAGK
jgi:protein TonB